MTADIKHLNLWNKDGPVHKKFECLAQFAEKFPQAFENVIVIVTGPSLIEDSEIFIHSSLDYAALVQIMDTATQDFVDKRDE